jgi:hypothetical protein
MGLDGASQSIFVQRAARAEDQRTIERFGGFTRAIQVEVDATAGERGHGRAIITCVLSDDALEIRQRARRVPGQARGVGGEQEIIDVVMHAARPCGSEQVIGLAVSARAREPAPAGSRPGRVSGMRARTRVGRMLGRGRRRSNVRVTFKCFLVRVCSFVSGVEIALDRVVFAKEHPNVPFIHMDLTVLALSLDREARAFDHHLHRTRFDQEHTLGTM